MHVEAWLPRAAALAPHATALQCPDGNATFAELLARARAGVAELAAEGVGPGDRVAIALPPGLRFAQALHATLLAGAVAVPVDLRLSDAEREAVAGGAALVIDAPLGDGRLAAGRRGGRPFAGAGGAQEPERHDLNATAAVIHTSGTSAAPKPVELSYGNFLWSALGSAAALGCEPHDRWLCPMPLSHVGGLSILIRSAIYATTAVVHDGFDTEHVVHALRNESITLVSFVATTLARALDAGLAGPLQLRCALTGGGPVPPELLLRARAAGVAAAPTYGLTEACSQVATAPVAGLGAGGSGGARPLFCTQVRIDGAEHPGGGADTVDRIGEILVAGPTVAPGSLAADGWLHTGDLGTLGSDGCLRVSGRRSETIISGGENVSPSEVEMVLGAHPDVLEAAVVGRADARWGEAVTAIVVPRTRDGADGDALRAFCADRLAPYKVPKVVEIRTVPLPRTPSGKLLRRALAGDQGSGAGGCDDPAMADRGKAPGT